MRHDWSQAEVEALFARPFLDLVFEAQTIHRQNFAPNQVQLSQLLSIKTGGCPEDCGYCPQASRYDTGLERQGLLPLEEVLNAAQAAKDGGATRFCMGAAWRSPKDHELEPVLEMVRKVKSMGLQTCVTLGMLAPHQAEALQKAGLDYYNHNLDTSPEHYGAVVGTRTYQDRLNTLGHVREAGIHVCSGGIVGMNESTADRAGLLRILANLPQHPESVPINLLVKVAGTPLAQATDLDPFELVRTISVARILMPQSMVRLSAGREKMSDELQAWCFMAGANSIFVGQRLLTTPNPGEDRDARLFARLGLRPMPKAATQNEAQNEAHV